MAVQSGPRARAHAPVVTWLVAPVLVALGLALALAAVVTLVAGMAPLTIAALVALVAATGGFWSMLDRARP